MHPTSLYYLAYEILDKSTPLKFDCGALCGRACCQNLPADEEAGENSGMYLFPGEDLLLKDASFLDIIPAEFEFVENTQVLIATCNGKCDRSLRPLSCRIFPLTPYLTEKDILTIRIDPRAVPVCPLAEDGERDKLHPDFVQNVRKACRILCSDPAIKAFINDLSRSLDEIIRFTGK